MATIPLLVILALALAGGGLYFFFWAVKDGQFDDVESPGVRILMDKEVIKDKKHDNDHKSE